jgi:hypothetical protein
MDWFWRGTPSVYWRELCVRADQDHLGVPHQELRHGSHRSVACACDIACEFILQDGRILAHARVHYEYANRSAEHVIEGAPVGCRVQLLRGFVHLAEHKSSARLKQSTRYMRRYPNKSRKHTVQQTKAHQTHANNTQTRNEAPLQTNVSTHESTLCASVYMMHDA